MPLFAVCYFSSLAQAQQPGSTLLVFRGQLKAMAQEIVARVPLDPPGRIFVSVEGDRLTTVVENAFVEAMTVRGFQPLVGIHGDSKEPILKVAVLDQSVFYNELRQGAFERKSRQALEARFEKGYGEPALIIGMFSRESLDTVAAKEDTSPYLQSTEQPAFMEQVFSPFVVIAASVAIIYLLFTVRS
ncbi:MAG TPA: hypothetical protein VI704_01880 [Bacteroidota bacterium]|nr:hypothetical protein [Bacteroidota bacterium]